MPLFLLTYWKQIGTIAIILGALITAGVYRGLYHHEKMLHEAFVQEVDAKAMAQEAHIKQVTQQQQEITKNVQSDWKQNAQALHDYYKSHPNIVRMCNTAYRGTVSIVPKAAEGTGANATGEGGTVEASSATEINLEIVGSGLLKLMKKDEWVDKQSAIK